MSLKSKGKCVIYVICTFISDTLYPCCICCHLNRWIGKMVLLCDLSNITAFWCRWSCDIAFFFIPWYSIDVHGSLIKFEYMHFVDKCQQSDQLTQKTIRRRPPSVMLDDDSDSQTGLCLQNLWRHGGIRDGYCHEPGYWKEPTYEGNNASPRISPKASDLGQRYQKLGQDSYCFGRQLAVTFKVKVNFET